MIEFFLGLLTSFLAIAVSKSIIEPIAQRFGQTLIKKYADTAFDRLDLEWLPEHYQDGLGNAKGWLLGTVLPEAAEKNGDRLEPKDLEKIANYVLQNFDLKASLSKQLRHFDR